MELAAGPRGNGGSFPLPPPLSPSGANLSASSSTLLPARSSRHFGKRTAHLPDHCPFQLTPPLASDESMSGRIRAPPAGWDGMAWPPQPIHSLLLFLRSRPRRPIPLFSTSRQLAAALLVPPFLFFLGVLACLPASSGSSFLRRQPAGRPMAALRVWDWEVDLDAALDVALWCLPLLLVAWLVAGRVARGDPLDPVADAAVAAAAVVAVVNVVARRLRPRCFWRR